jgi:subtilase family serine protease
MNRIEDRDASRRGWWRWSRAAKTAGGAIVAGSAAAVLLAGCGSSSVPLSIQGLDKRVDPTRPPPPGVIAPTPPIVPDPPGLRGEIGLPAGSADEITFYFSLPVDDYWLREAAKAMTTPGTGSYRHFMTNYADAGRRYGAKPSVIEAAVKSVRASGLSVMVDPSRTFARVWGTAERWKKALGEPLTVQKGKPSSPFDIYSLPTVPTFDHLTYVGGGATVYDAGIDDGGSGYGASVADAAQIDQARATGHSIDAGATKLPWPANTGAFPVHTCGSAFVSAHSVYAPSQVATAYGVSALKETRATRAVRVSVIDLGGGYLDSDILAAARCFGYAPPRIDVQTGDGITGRIGNNNQETELDLQTIAAYVPGARIQLVEATNGPTSQLDAISRTLADPRGFPDAASISYAQCAVQESQNNLLLIQAIARVAILGSIVGSSLFAAAGDWGSTTCGNSVRGTSQAFVASGTWVTAVGGTRLILNSRNQRVKEVAWNDKPYGIIASGGGGVSKVFKRPFYQNGVTTSTMRVVPDFAMLADIQPGWPVMLNGQIQSIGGTSGSSPFAMAQFGLLSARQRLAGRPRVGFINPWIYELYKEHPHLFYDVTSGGNDVNGVGCCRATKGFDEVTGLGVPNLTAIARDLPPPSP